jgi:DNA-binding beta-propeller fold protein YncE
MDETALTSTLDRTITLSALSMDEAREQARAMLAPMVEVQYLAPSLYSFTLGPKRVYNLVRTWGGHGQRVEEFYAPAGIALDQAGRVYVTDNGLYMSKSGTLKQPYSRVVKFDANGRWLAMWGERGEREEQLLEAQGLAIDAAGNVWVADGGSGKIVVYEARMR